MEKEIKRIEKDIEKKEKDINDSKDERARCKTKYDTQIFILEAQREAVLRIEADNNRLFDEYKIADEKVQKLIKEKNELVQELETRNTKLETKTENHES